MFNWTDPTQPIRLGLLLNQRARRMRDLGSRQALLSASLGLPVASPQHLDELPSCLQRLFEDEGVNVLAVAGGDGTLHYAVNACASLCHRAGVSLPLIAPLSAGTLNIVARTARVREQPEATFSRIRQRFEGRRLESLPVREVQLLEVLQPDHQRRYGFVFGSETLYHAIELYVRFGAGYRGLSRFLFELSRGAIANSNLWRAEGWKMGPHPGAVQIDAEQWDSYLAAVATTVDLSLAVFAIRAIAVPEDATGFFAKVLTDASAREVIAQIPSLLRNRPSSGVIDRPNSQRMRLVGPYTLDGELFGEPDQRPRSVVEVGLADARVGLLVP